MHARAVSKCAVLQKLLNRVTPRILSMSTLVREATLEDRPGVLAIPVQDVYQDRDYLPGLYEEFITSPHCKNLVLVIDGKVVGFENYLIHDDGTTIQRRSVRVDPAHRDQGMTFLLERCITHMCPGAMYFQYLQNFNRHRSVPETPSLKMMDMTKEFLYPVPRTLTRKLRKPSLHPRDIQQLWEKDVIAILKDKSVHPFLFPKNMIYVNTVALSPTTDNLHHIFNKRTTIFGSFQRSERIAEYSDSYLALLTVGDTMPVSSPGKYRHVVTVFGDCRYHLGLHLERHQTSLFSLEDLAYFSVITDAAVSNDIVDAAASSSGLQVRSHLVRRGTFRYHVTLKTRS